MNLYKAAFVSVLLLLSTAIKAQIAYYVPTHYQGIFYMQPTSARATGMGLTTITLPGIEVAFYNPATLGLMDEKMEVHVNYARGSHVYKGGQFPFIGASYRVLDKLVIGASTHNWVGEKDPIWTTIIGSYNESVERRSQSVYTLTGAYEIISGLQFGLSGNILVDRSVDDAVTNSQFILSAGTIYDLENNWIKSEKVRDQKIRFAGSFVNLLMKNRIEQTYQDHLHYRDLPIHLNLGTSYHLSFPFKAKFTERCFFKGAPSAIDLSLHLQYKEVLRGPKREVVSSNYKYNSSFGIGIEAWLMKLTALRMGYYVEKRPSGPQEDEDGGYWATDNKRGFTWGMGVNVPWNNLLKNNVPLKTEVNLVINKLMNEYGNTVTIPDYFTDRSFLFAIGVNLQWVKKEAVSPFQ